RINIDDFGTGYASLSRLRCFPFGSVKIDRTFIRDVTVDPDDAAIVAAITAVGHNLRMNVIAEGVETAEQASFLIRNQIDAMQGPYFGEPAPADEALQVLQAAAAPARRSA
ncbi:MAG: EAL domain-containing protein, partial [Candidatus Polarisedimenticolia bacterium]